MRKPVRWSFPASGQAMKRREFIKLLGSTAAAWPLGARAQQHAMPVIGFLGALTASGRESQIAAFHAGLREAGYTEGRDIAIEARWAEGHFDRLPDMAAELVQRQVAVIVVFTTPAGLAAKAATSTIPIVLLTGDPVGTGLVASLARPGGNITGMSFMVPESHGKCVELLRDMLSSVRRVGALLNGGDPSKKQILEQIQIAGQATGIEIAPIVTVSENSEFDAAFSSMKNEQANAVVIHASLPAAPVANLALKYSLPTATSLRQFAEAGGLISFGAVETDLWRRSAFFVRKILQGSKPADLPIEQPIKFELLLNLKTAKALHLTVPPSLLDRADEVIE
jgi:putative tryptophan/tyrosine transport system substrate-binding protein